MKNNITRKFAILLLPLIALAATGPAQAESRNIEFDSVEEKI
ncbi:hypothetical protein [Sphingopyxis sp. BSNA05]|nr:hypothetical protein [Sphingopyxis sp. BSNA05]